MGKLYCWRFQVKINGFRSLVDDPQVSGLCGLWMFVWFSDAKGDSCEDRKPS